MSNDKEEPELNPSPLDDQFMELLHKKTMHKQGAAKRRSKKYYRDQYKKTGRIPTPLLLVKEGVMDGRRCSGRKAVLSQQVKKRFTKMVQASSDPDDPRFIFITREARKIINYHKWLEEEFGHAISLQALYRYSRQAHLHLFLDQEDFDDLKLLTTFFNPVEVFDLVQIDGCVLQYLKIRNAHNGWQKPCVIESFDTGSRYMFTLDWYFSENNLNSVDLFSKFLLSTPFPDKTIRIRPDGAKGFLNLQRPIQELNQKFSMRPEGFFLVPDFSRPRAPKDKVHLESSHRSLHNFEIRIIKAFEKKIVRTEPGVLFKNKKVRKVTITLLDITLPELADSGLLELYRKEHNDRKHRFSEAGRTQSWCPSKKLRQYLQGRKSLIFLPADVEQFMKYGFEKKRATVNKDKTLVYQKQKYVVVVGAEKFSSYSSTKVQVSSYLGKLFLFEHALNGVFLGEAVRQEPSETPKSVTENLQKRMNAFKPNEMEQITAFLEKQGMNVKVDMIVDRYRKGMRLNRVKQIYQSNKARYDKYTLLLKEEPQMVALAIFNAFVSDWDRAEQKSRRPGP